MEGTLRLTSNALAYGDQGATSNPARRYFDWSTDRKYAVSNPKNEPYTIDPGATQTLFSGLRSTSIAANTEWTLALSALASDRYRFSNSAGTAPALRTARTLTLAGGANVQMTLNANATVSMARSAADFANVVVGDTIFIPDTTTGDSASPFDDLNVGYWTVLAKNGSGSQVELARPTGTVFTGKTEAVAVASNAQVIAYSAAGVQVGDKVTISAGFSAPVLGTYTLVAVTPSWFEITTSKAFPVAAVAVPGVSGVQFYTGAKRYVRFEGDQEFAVRLNGATDSSQIVAPWAAGDDANTGTYEKCGPAWSVVVVNVSSEPLNLLFSSAE